MLTRLASVGALLAQPAAAQHHHHDVLELRQLGVYPGYTGKPIEGGATLRFHDEGNVTIDFYLYNTEAECAAPNATAPNSCGIHIHEGKSCANATAPGGHYYNKTQCVHAHCPWTGVAGVGALRSFQEPARLLVLWWRWRRSRSQMHR